MRGKLRRGNTRRLASLTALGASAGALGLSPATADASVIDVQLNQSVPPGIQVPLPGGATFGLAVYAIGRTRTIIGGSRSKIRIRYNTQKLVLGASFLTTISSFFSRSGRRRPGTGLLATRVSYTATEFRNGKFYARVTHQPFAHSDKVTPPYNYFLFTFTNGTQTLHGWGDVANVSVSSTSGPSATLVEYAYDDSGAFLPPGATTVPTPEPVPVSTVPAALAALVLGAAGVRRWRARD